MADLAQLLLQQRSQGQLNRQADLAKMLMQSGQKTTNPLVAALSGFVGTHELQGIADKQGETDKALLEYTLQKEEKDQQLKEKEFGLKEQSLGLEKQKTAAILAKTAAEIKSLQQKAATGGLDLKDIITAENTIRDDYVKASGEYVKQRDAFGRIQASAAEPSAAGDLALIFNYMKLLDPGSTVREGEFANAQNAGGVDQKTLALYNNIVKGERLSEDIRGDFVKRSGMLFNQAQAQQDQLAGVYTGIAQRTPGLNPENIVIPLGLAETKEGKEKAAPSFANEQEVEAANLPKGTKIIIGGRPAVIE